MQKKQPAIKDQREIILLSEKKKTEFGTDKVVEKEGGGRLLIKPIKVYVSVCVSFGGS